MTDSDQCRRLADATLEAFGRVDAVVSNAYTEDVFKTFRKVDLYDRRRLVDVNLFGPLQVTQAFVPAMTEQGALFTAAHVLAKELSRFGIRDNSVLAGWMWGPQVEMYVRMTAENKGVPEQEVLADITKDIAPARYRPTPTSPGRWPSS